ncbi:enoyl-CoA hydratase/isomerase family protein [Streptomyces liangshanensis]|uniref:Enoyl-CoA hydratase/isomerase family protein n=1 Tax=Streptomyces liangshanensis TaxID=2717324 RepID=A0A6G9H751_9ACTN|nr:enoyl-CoA hydratase/isomerase family protein [Streptomyces liangshanensis]QIQ06079.1 enoyl-CoA hydratase/isomerase family protein [Streptomyces liangshanensis]
MNHLTLTKPSPSMWRVSFDNPPVNVISSRTIVELRALVDAAEADPDLTVIVFESANPDFFSAHWDLTDDTSSLASEPPPVTGQQAFVDVLIRLSKLPVISISSIRGRARGAGSEFLLATDIRFASRERALLGQFEMTTGLAPGGGAVSRLPRLVGRARALEILAGADDFDGDLAERYGYVNRSVPDAELDGFVDTFARRVAAADRDAVAELKGWVNEMTLPEDQEFRPQSDAFFARAAGPKVSGWIGRAFERGLQQPGDLENRLGTRGFEV